MKECFQSWIKPVSQGMKEWRNGRSAKYSECADKMQGCDNRVHNVQIYTNKFVVFAKCLGSRTKFSTPT